MPITEPCPPLTSALVSAFWNRSITDLILDGCRNLEWLIRLPSCAALTVLSLNGCTVPIDVFRWALTNRSLSHLSLTWLPQTRLPWSELKKLRRLRHLDLQDSYLDDDQLAEIAAASRPRVLCAYYAALTPKAWRTILSWPGLKQFWGSEELIRGEWPDDLPASTEVKECVALNAHAERFRALLARYPGVEVVEM